MGFGTCFVLGKKIKGQAVSAVSAQGSAVSARLAFDFINCNLLLIHCFKTLYTDSGDFHAEALSLTWLSLSLQLQCCVRLLLYTFMTVLHFAPTRKHTLSQ